LTDAVADELAVPFDRISLKMLFRGLYHFHHAYSKCNTDPVLFFAAPENNNLDVMKTIRKKVNPEFISVFPDKSCFSLTCHHESIVILTKAKLSLIYHECSAVEHRDSVNDYGAVTISACVPGSRLT